MNKQEFEKLTGWEVSDETFKMYEEMYMNAGDDIDKKTFCKEMKALDNSMVLLGLNNKIEELRKIIIDQHKELDLRAEAGRDQRKEIIDFLIEEAHEMSSMKARNKAISLMGGRAPYLAEIMRRGYNLWEIDKTDMIEVLDNI